MKPSIPLTIVLALLLIQAGLAQETTFTYQGLLNDRAVPATGQYDLRFSLYPSSTHGAPLSQPVTNFAINVSNGIFTATLDFGSGVFSGLPRWLEIAVRTNGPGLFATLSPRQQITATPYSLYAARAGAASVLPKGDLVVEGEDGPANLAVTGGLNVNGDVHLGTSSAGNSHIQSEGTLYLNPFSPRKRVIVGGGDGDADFVVTGSMRLDGFGGGGRYISSSQRLHLISETEHVYLLPGGTTGQVIVGGAGRDADMTITGSSSVKTLTIRGGADIAEPFRMSAPDIPKGSIVVIDEENPGQLKLSEQTYDKRVAGIISGANGIQCGLSLSQEGVLDGGQNVALSGRVYALADASDGPIKPGDLLTTSRTPGHCMKVSDSAKAQGAIIGKAMGALQGGKGMILVLVSLQ